MDRSGKKWTVSKIKEQKSYEWKDLIWEMVELSGESGKSPEVDYPVDPECVVRREAPVTKVSQVYRDIRSVIPHIEFSGNGKVDNKVDFTN